MFVEIGMRRFTLLLLVRQPRLYCWASAAGSAVGSCGPSRLLCSASTGGRLRTTIAAQGPRWHRWNLSRSNAWCTISLR